ncbi:MAG: hypothetical protein ABIJ93_01930 [candidate division WOR-3 bacterium]
MIPLLCQLSYATLFQILIIGRFKSNCAEQGAFIDSGQRVFNINL